MPCFANCGLVRLGSDGPLPVWLSFGQYLQKCNASLFCSGKCGFTEIPSIGQRSATTTAWIVMLSRRCVLSCRLTTLWFTSGPNLSLFKSCNATLSAYVLHLLLHVRTFTEKLVRRLHTRMLQRPSKFGLLRARILSSVTLLLMKVTGLMVSVSEVEQLMWKPVKRVLAAPRFRAGRKSDFSVKFPSVAVKVRQVQKQARRLQSLLRLLQSQFFGNDHFGQVHELWNAIVRSTGFVPNFPGWVFSVLGCFCLRQ